MDRYTHFGGEIRNLSHYIYMKMYLCTLFSRKHLVWHSYFS